MMTRDKMHFVKKSERHFVKRQNCDRENTLDTKIIGKRSQLTKEFSRREKSNFVSPFFSDSEKRILDSFLRYSETQGGNNNMFCTQLSV